MTKVNKYLFFLLLQCFIIETTVSQTLNSWQTNSQSQFVQQSSMQFSEGTGSKSIKITINDNSTYQTIDGFGWTMTQGGAKLIMEMNESSRNVLLQDLFGSEGVSSEIVRIGVGATDLSEYSYTYEDTQGQFALSGPDLTYLIPVLKQIKQINPAVKFLATPWTAPRWMKSKNSYTGGSLSKYNEYADYLVNYCRAMDAEGLSIYALSIQNEPLNNHNNPSMYMTQDNMYDFAGILGPKMEAAGYGSVKLIGYDHNCDNTEYPIRVAQSPYIDATAFHLYAGTIDAMSTVFNTSGKDVYFTEQYTAGEGFSSGDFNWHMENVMLGSVLNMSKTALAWNTAARHTGGGQYEPHTDGGCDDCMGAVTIDGNSYTKNTTYYTIAHLSKVVRSNAQRIGTTQQGSASSLIYAAFDNQDGTFSLVIRNASGSSVTLDVVHNGKSVAYTIDRQTTVSMLWGEKQILVPVTGITVEPNSISVEKGKTYQLTATVLPQNATDKSLLWSVDDEQIAVISADGAVRGINTGTTTVTATNASSNVSASCAVTITPATGFTGDFPHVYNLISVYSNKGLDVKDKSLLPGANMQQWEVANNGGDNQRWIFEYVQDDIYYIKSKLSGLYLTATNSVNGSDVVQQAYNNSLLQQWEVTQADNDNYKIINSQSTKAVDIEGPSTSNGANIYTWEYTNASNQKWKFVPVEIVANNKIIENNKQTITIYPNPADKQLHIQFSEEGQGSMKLFTVSGSLTLSEKISEKENTIDVSGLEKGIYVLMVQHKEHTVYSKIIKQ